MLKEPATKFAVTLPVTEFPPELNEHAGLVIAALACIVTVTISPVVASATPPGLSDATTTAVSVGMDSQLLVQSIVCVASDIELPSTEVGTEIPAAARVASAARVNREIVAGTAAANPVAVMVVSPAVIVVGLLVIVKSTSRYALSLCSRRRPSDAVVADIIWVTWTRDTTTPSIEAISASNADSNATRTAVFSSARIAVTAEVGSDIDSSAATVVV